jgi:glycosyltransferase involved in cell wall biosynthesis
MARELAERLPYVTVNAGSDTRRADPRASLNYYMPARDFLSAPCKGPALALYTHGASALDLVDRFTACLAMNEAMAATLRAHGAKRVQVVRPGVDPVGRGPIVFGVIGRVYNNGRKGEALVEAAVRAGFNVIACGPDTRIRAMTRRQWPCPTPYTVHERAAFYRAIDYLLVTSTLEGGPMPVVEAIAHGVPVIAPKGVGWCDEFPCHGRYEPGKWSSLEPILRALTSPPTWAAWAEAHRPFFEEAIGRAA